MGVIDIDRDPYRGNRWLACAEAIWTIGKSVHDDSNDTHTLKPILVFVNERERAEELADFLKKKGISAEPFTRDTTEARQSEILSAFTSRERVEGAAKGGEDLKKQKLGIGSFVPFADNASDENGTERKGTFSRKLGKHAGPCWDSDLVTRYRHTVGPQCHSSRRAR